MQNQTMQNQITTWPDLAIGLYDKLTGRGAEITYEFEDMQIGVPNAAQPDAPSIPWKVSGTLRVRTRDQKES